MSDEACWKALEAKFVAALPHLKRPVAVSFVDAPPDGVERAGGSQPSGCSFWRLAAAGQSFYTLPEDHFNCAVGAYTHNIPLSPAREGETQQTLQMMFDAGYVLPAEIPRIPHLSKTPGAIVYAPLGQAPVAPDAVLFACTPANAMLLNEAIGRAGVASGAPALGRPTCMALPAALEHGSMLSLGCIGNRVYTGLGEDELYVVVRGKDLAAVADALAAIVTANEVLHSFAQERRAQLSDS